MISLKDLVKIYNREKINLRQEENIAELFLCASNDADESCIELLLDELGKNPLDINTSWDLKRLVTIVDVIDIYQHQIYPGNSREKWLYNTLKRFGSKHSRDMSIVEILESVSNIEGMKIFPPFYSDELEILKERKRQESLNMMYEWNLNDF
jgi:hypothetical protein